MDMDEIQGQFDLAGLTVTKDELKEYIKSCKNIEMKKGELSLSDFTKLSLSLETNIFFKKWVKKMRRKFKYADYATVSENTKFIPFDVSLMNAYMYQCLTHKKLVERIDDSEANNPKSSA